MAMATLSTPFLPHNTQEDTMELSSPANRTLDEDIELDFDEAANIPLVDDDHMDDDVVHDDPIELDEDMIHYDDDDLDLTATDVNIAATVPDEDLIDYSDDDEEVIQPAVHQVNAPFLAQKEETSIPQQAQLQQQEEAAVVTSAEPEPPLTAATDADLAHEDVTVDLPATVKTAVEAEQSHLETSAEQQTDHYAEQSATTLNAEAQEFVPVQQEERGEEVENDVAEEEEVPEEGDLKPRLSTTSFVPTTEGPGTPTDTGLHPVILYYADQAYPLFRSGTALDGLLKDDNLASISLADLIKACRQSLVMRTQQDIDTSFELVLTFDHLSLSVYEDAPAAFQISLQEVIDVYLQLQSNDGHEDHECPPLSVSCSLQIKFNNSIQYLRDAAERGEGLSSVVPSHDEQQDVYNNAEEHDDYQEEEALDGEHHEDTFSDEQPTAPEFVEDHPPHEEAAEAPEQDNHDQGPEHAQTEALSHTASSETVPAAEIEVYEQTDDVADEHGEDLISINDWDDNHDTTDLVVSEELDKSDDALQQIDETQEATEDTTDKTVANDIPISAPKTESEVPELEYELVDDEPSATTSPSTKRQREEEAVDDDDNSSKKLRST